MLNFDNLGIWLISLPKDRRRRERVEQQLLDLNLDFQLFSAIDGRARKSELIAKADSDLYARNMGSPLLPGKLGVYASHVDVWHQLLKGPCEAGLILEDDIIFHDDFKEALDIALKNSNLWDLVRFSCVRAKIPVTQAYLGKYRLNAYIGPFTGNACYLIKRETASILTSSIWPQTRALDHELNLFFKYNYRQLGLEPWPSHTDDGGISSITGVDYNLVSKFPWHMRLSYYRTKALNYIKRFAWLLKNKMIKF